MRIFSSTQLNLLRLTGVTALLLLTGCGGSNKASNSGSQPNVLSRESRVGDVSNNGLEIRMWIVPDSPAVVGYAMTEFTDEARIDSGVLDALNENGMRLYELSVHDVEALRSALSGNAREDRSWFGQVFDWRELWQRSLGNSSRGVAIDGRVRSFAGGAFTLLTRSWTIKTLEGPRLHVEIVPYYEDIAGGFRRAMNEQRRGILTTVEPPGEAFPTISLQVDLEPGRAYVLTSESPSIDWASPDVHAGRYEKKPTVDNNAIGQVRGGIGPDGGVGPASFAPTTLGELLLRGEEGSDNRLVIILLPHLPAELFPQELRTLPIDEESELQVRDAGDEEANDA